MPDYSSHAGNHLLLRNRMKATLICGLPPTQPNIEQLPRPLCKIPRLCGHQALHYGMLQHGVFNCIG